MSAEDYCPECHQDYQHGEHSPWCSRGDPGQRPAPELIWQRLDELDEKINRLARAIGLPEDWDDDD